MTTQRCDIQQLGSADVDDAANLLNEAFADDPGFQFVFRTARSRERWLKKIFTAESKIAVAYGKAMGMRLDPQNELIATAIWYLPTHGFPPPIHRSLIPSLPILPIVLEVPTYLRLYQVYQLTISLLPRRERFLYLAELAVRADQRNKQLGTRLIEWGQEFAANANCRVALICRSALVPYYKQFGFTPCAEGKLTGLKDAYHCLVWRS